MRHLRCDKGIFFFETTRQCLVYFPVLQNVFIPIPQLMSRADDAFKSVLLDYAALPDYQSQADEELRQVILLEVRASNFSSVYIICHISWLFKW